MVKSVLAGNENEPNNDNVSKGINDVIDEGMKYEPKILVPDIDDHVFTSEDGVDDDGMDDEEQEMMMEIGRLMMRPCLMDLVLVGWNKLKEMNVKKIRMVADERVQRKRTTTKYIMDRFKSMKHDLMLASVPDEQENVEESEWVSYMQELRLDYYN